MDAIPIDSPTKFLRYLHARRFSDREIADYLNDPLSYLLHKHPDVVSPLILYAERPTETFWTRRMVRRWRKKLGLASPRCVRREMKFGRTGKPNEAYETRRQAYAARWVTLGLDLRPRQVDILDALHEEGPQ